MCMTLPRGWPRPALVQAAEEGLPRCRRRRWDFPGFVPACMSYTALICLIFFLFPFSIAPLFLFYLLFHTDKFLCFTPPKTPPSSWMSYLSELCICLLSSWPRFLFSSRPPEGQAQTVLSIVQKQFTQCKINTVRHPCLLFFFSLFIDIFVSTLNKTTVLLHASRGTFFFFGTLYTIRNFYSSGSTYSFFKCYPHLCPSELWLPGLGWGRVAVALGRVMVLRCALGSDGGSQALVWAMFSDSANSVVRVVAPLCVIWRWLCLVQ